jgi:hypothetical protein
MTWDLQDVETDDHEYLLNDLCLIDETMGWAVGNTGYPFEGVMLHTENGGGGFVYPELAYTPTLIDFGEMYGAQNDTANITIWNNGTGTLNYYLYPDETWVMVSPEGGFSSGEQDTVVVTIDTGGLQPGEYVCNLTVFSNDEIVVIPVYVTIIASDQILAFEPQYYDFGEMGQYQMETLNLSIWNSGTGTMFYWIDDFDTFCVVEPWSGSSQGEVNTHTVMCFTSPLELGEHQCNLTIYGGNQTGILTIDVTVVEGGTEPIEAANQSIFDRGFPIRHAADGDWGGGQNHTLSTNYSYMSKIFLRKFGTPEFNLTVELREDHPQGTLLDTLSFTPEEVPSTWTWFELDFQDQVVEENANFFIVIPPAPSNVSTSFGYEWGYAFGDQYEDGAFWFTRDGGGLWRDLPDSYEFDFKSYGYN